MEMLVICVIPCRQECRTGRTWEPEGRNWLGRCRPTPGLFEMAPARVPRPSGRLLEQGGAWLR